MKLFQTFFIQYILANVDSLPGGSFSCGLVLEPSHLRAARELWPGSSLSPLAGHGRGRALQVGGEAEHGLQPDPKHHH